MVLPLIVIVKDSYMKKVEISGPGEKVVDRMVASGRCESANEVVDISLRLLEKHEEKLQALRDDINVAMDEIHGGNVAPLDMEAVKKKARERHERQHPPA